MPPITLCFLQSSRSIRTAWLLEELSLDYDVKFSDRMADGRASQEDRDAVGTAMGKFPTIKDGDDVVMESGAITQYLCEKYDKLHRLIPSDPAARIKALEWLHAAEATFALHSLAIVYARWYYPKEAPAEGLAQMEASMSKNVENDFGWLEGELEKSSGGFLVGKEVTVADVMMQFGVRFIFEKELGTKRDRWPRTEEWLKRCEECEAYKRAVKKTGHVFS
ncbi:glutathione S-transferase [Phyllosticta citribraziliensis]|uniref:Glutathione S-transferase n=1 Tax=Phyllosticta citribraziliensis TaxID=989973 RepID=A0ABR1MAU8_9PEZI